MKKGLCKRLVLLIPMHYNLVPIFVLLFSISSQSQVTFEKTIFSLHNQSGNDVIQTTDSCYVVIGGQAGNYYQWPLNHLMMVKTNKVGNVLWTKYSIEGFGDSWGFGIQQTHDNGFIACGKGPGYINEPYLIRAQLNGDTVWTNYYDLEGGYNVALSVCQTADHGFALCGNMNFSDILVLRTDSVGEKLWTKIFDGPDFQNGSGMSIIQTRDTNLAICGYRGDTSILIKLSLQGDSIWMKYFDEFRSNATSLKQTEDGGFIICGYTLGENNTKDCFLLKTDEEGNVQWTKTYDGTDQDYAQDIEITPDKGYILCGTTFSYGHGNSDVYLIRTNDNGDTLWTRAYGSALDEEGRGIDCTYDGGFIITGYKYVNDTLYNVFLIKTDEEGMTGEWEAPFETNNYLTVFPNPAVEQIHVRLSMDDGRFFKDLRLEIYDIYGRKVQNPALPRTEEGGWTLDVSGLPQGIYLVSLNDGETVVADSKFVVVR
jgi:hypothetical protein